MYLSKAIEFTFENRDSWANGKGSQTARINSNHCLRILGDIPVEEIESRHFAVISSQLKKEGKKPGTINRICAALSTVINELRQHGYKLDEPCYKRQKESKGRPGYYSDEQLQALLDTAQKERDGKLLYDSILFSAKTGCRQGELLELTIDDVDFDNLQITFRDVKQGGDHIVPLHKDLIEIIDRRMEYAYSGLLFPWSSADTLRRTFKRVQEEAGVPDTLCWHELRHTVATTLCAKGVPLRTVMGVLGHKNINTTLRYAHVVDKAVVDAVELL